MLKISIFQIQGNRPLQEDRSVIAPIGEGHLLAMFDGHGGSVVAEAAAERVVG